MTGRRPLSAVVLAAGEGTRMRSSRPKPLHLLCGRPMLLHVLDALAELPSTGSWSSSATAPSGSPRSCRSRRRPTWSSTSSSSTSSGAPATPSPSALTAFPDDDVDDGDIVVLPGDTPLLRPATLAALVARPPRQRRRRHPAHRRVDDPTRLRPDRAGQGRPGRPDRRGGRRRPTRSGRSTRSTRRSTASGAALLAPALRRLSPDNAQGEYYLTDVVEVLSDAGLPGRRHRGRRSRPRSSGVNDRAQLAAAEAELRRPHQRALDARGRHHARPRAHLHRRHGRSWRPTSPSSPAPCCRARTVVGDGRRDRARRPAGRLRRSARAPWSSRPSATTPRSATARTSGRSPCSSPGSHVPDGRRDRAVLHCDRRRREPCDRRSVMELIPKKRCSCIAGRSHPALAEEIADAPRRRAGRAQPRRVRQRRDPLPLRRVDPRHRRVHRPDPLRGR